MARKWQDLTCILFFLNGELGIKLIPNSSFGKKWCMLNLAIFLSCSAFHLTVVCTLAHDRPVDNILSNSRTYILLFSCAYLKCDEEGSSCGFKWAHIPLTLYQYISYIVPIFLFPKFLYSYISEAHSCLTPCMNVCEDKKTSCNEWLCWLFRWT